MSEDYGRKIYQLLVGVVVVVGVVGFLWWYNHTPQQTAGPTAEPTPAAKSYTWAQKRYCLDLYDRMQAIKFKLDSIKETLVGDDAKRAYAMQDRANKIELKVYEVCAPNRELWNDLRHIWAAKKAAREANR